MSPTDAKLPFVIVAPSPAVQSVSVPARQSGELVLTAFGRRENARIAFESAVRQTDLFIAQMRSSSPDVPHAIETAANKSRDYGIKRATLLIAGKVVGSSSLKVMENVDKVTSGISVIFTAVQIAQLLVLDIKLLTYNVVAN